MSDVGAGIIDEFHCRNIAITGAGSGIGRAVCLLIAERGAHIIAMDIGNSAENTAKEITANGGSASAYDIDVTDRKAIEYLFAKLASLHEHIDGIVTCAGIMQDDLIADIEPATFDRIIDINLKGTLWCIRAAAAIMSQQGSGSIVTLSSTVADRPTPRTAAYAITKAATVQLTQILALEVAGANVRVNAVAPGIVETGITQRHYLTAEGTIDETKRQEVLTRLAATSPLNRVGAPEEIAYAIAYLLSDCSSFMTGQVLRLNGGTVMV